MTDLRCDHTGLLVYACADCRSGVHTVSYESEQPAEPVIYAPIREDKLTPASTVPTLAGECNYLLAAFEHLIAADWIDEAMSEIKGIWDALTRAHGLTRPQSLGSCLTVTDTIPCPGKVYPDRFTGLPKCSTCRRTYVGLDSVRLAIMQEKTA